MTAYVPPSTGSGAEAVDNELEGGFNADFEHRFRHVEVGGRLFLGLVVAVALSGLLGRGPLSHSTTKAPDGVASVDYEPLARNGTPTTVTLHLHQPAPATVDVVLDGHFMEPMGLQSIEPRPATSLADHGNLRLAFQMQPGAGGAMIRFGLQPASAGIIPMAATVQATGMPTTTLHWSQVVLP